MDTIPPGYRIGRQIYESANSLVYRATRTHDDRSVILKVLKPDYPNLAELSRYNQENEILRQLNATGVIRVYGLEVYRNTLVLVLEDFGGLSISEWLRRSTGAARAPVPLAQYLEIASKIAAALGQIHLSGVIHKNVNPSNIVFNPDTRELKMIDFGLATTLNRETPTLAMPQALEGTLSYISPEQSGRMNRTVDYRTDFYSLGVTFYELLTGRLPFEAADTLELVHAHLAKSPVAPHVIDPAIPEEVSDLVLKLMEKAPEDRYQSAQGIKYDLDLCRQQVQSGQIYHFELGKRDWTDRFLIAEKLYGREVEIQTLISAFERVAHGSSELVLVTGVSGVGKTAVINEIHTPIVRRRGHFIKGKFDQLSRNIPFSAFVQAFRDLMGQLLSESKAQRQRWQSAILSALGGNARVITEVLPELERMIGPQPPVPELSVNAAQNRFNLLLQRFIAVFTTAEHPLVIFLDDLHWADLASLKLIQLLMSESSTGYMLLLGAYRENEVSPDHPLITVLNEIDRTAVPHSTLHLEPLGQSDINQLVADTLTCSPEISIPLTRLIYQKTHGNPFFSNQFLKTLYDEKLITYDHELGQWTFDIAQISQLALTEDVIEFVALGLQKLPVRTQEILKVAACIGNQFDLETLAIMQQSSSGEAAYDLWQAVRAGAVFPQEEVYEFAQTREHVPSSINLGGTRTPSPTYRFLHDRVQQAAYSLIPEGQRPALHLSAGRLLLSQMQKQQQEERLFEIISQFNAGLSQITETSERDTLARLNLRAGQKAKSATAYPAAMSYLITALNLLPPDSWQTDFPLTLALYYELVEVAYLTGNFEQMEQWAMLVLQQATSLEDKVKVFETQIYARIACNQLKEALDLGLSVLDELGTTFPEQPDQAEIVDAFEQVSLALAQKPVSELLHLPCMTDPASLAMMRIMFSMGAPAYLVDPPLFPLLIVRQLIQSIHYGNTTASVYAYASYGMLLCGILGDIERGHEFGLLAMNLLPHLQAKEVQARTYFTYYTFIHHWKFPIAETLSPLLEAYYSGLETGDLEFACYAVCHRLINAYFTGHELNALAKEIATFRTAIHGFHQENPYYYLGTCQQAVLNMLGHSDDPCSLVSDAYDETRMLPLYEQAHDTTALHHLYIHKLILCYLLGNNEQALEYASRSAQYVAGVPGIAAVVHYFYDSLVRLSSYDQADPETRAVFLQQVKQNQDILQPWAASAPMNYQHKFELIEAERCRVLGEMLVAMDWYDRAITGAKTNGYLQEEALANELAARFYLGQGKVKIAQVYMLEAYHGYRDWGAAAKTAHLERLYAPMLTPVLKPQRYPSSLVDSTTSESLDLVTVIKSSQVIAGQIELDRLLQELIQIALENAGAQRAVLLLKRDSNWVIEAVGDIDKHDIQVFQAHDLSGSDSVPHTLINQVIRTHQNLLLDDASEEFTDDPYIKRHCVKSVLCIQLLNRGGLSGILYLENNLTPRAFTVERLELLNLLATQMAISLDNARLYSGLEAKVIERTKELQAANEHLKALSRVKDEFVSNVSHELRTPIANMMLYRELISTRPEQQEKYLNVLGREIRRLSDLIEALLFLSRLDQERVELRCELIDLNTLLSQFVEDRRLLAARKGLDLSFTSQEKSPCVLADESLLSEIFSILLTNATNYTPAGGVINIAVSQSGDQWRVSVSDTGPGIEPSEQEKVFERFFRGAASRESPVAGTGLGLSIAKEIVERHQGRIEVSSSGKPGEGATFIVSLPKPAESV